ncbi:uncharacterized protein LOC121272415 [Carcharodon carcharias]|uniref:uncharacterized protein LOC121272415 n=1 Tax=Carcharodon carcharias TaxID=13397 RepID=UPI001B7F5C2E|nr:uncharacterized protein LOC121272415 [Carcharodon carcharias]XP_041035008.1 uncharacterized protein LOC121272415 [Carcharodon carcharias]XP_041035009.1 uncharacterized protein LOC121272415 [Carcharodon carcharias]XP_041035010.1 uncharacterized protein LOC121272415 [Carcharodon carcharias]XP_041035011.1 uncharacterized protein LOC121272415 [Carcharodon carcharias]XP_041035012.1 uncharacterized protein LOC121272415 [Carcharodon carcharias]XP_041035013.1 uncharacterized protein LOC121272415 [
MAVQKADERKKCHNFSDEDLDILLNEVEAKRHRLLGYDKRRAPRKVSILAWKEVAETVTANSTIPRTAEQCRKKLNDLTRSARIKMAHNAQERLLTRDGGVAFLKDLNEYEERARQLVGVSNSSVSGNQADIGMGRGAQPSLDTPSGDGSESVAATSIVERRPADDIEPRVKEEESVTVIELKEEVEWHPDEQEAVHPGWEGKRSGTVTPVSTLHLQDADVGGMQSWDNIQIATSPSPGPSCSERGTDRCHPAIHEPDATGLVGGCVIDRSEMSSGEGPPTVQALDPSSSVTRGPLQPHVETSVEEVEEVFVAGLRDILVAQHDRQLDSLDLIRQEMTGLCHEVRELKTALCQEVRDLKTSLCHEVRELKTSLCQQLALSIQKLTDALTATKQIQHYQDAASDLNQIPIQTPTHAAGMAVTQMSPIEPFLMGPRTETVHELAATSVMDAASGQQHPNDELSVAGHGIGTRGVRSRVRGRRRRH